MSETSAYSLQDAGENVGVLSDESFVSRWQSQGKATRRIAVATALQRRGDLQRRRTL